jgi:spore germination cell wall hydrolase CwlJ-like protein
VLSAWTDSGDEDTRKLHYPQFANAVLFHAESVRPEWASRARLVEKVGRHIFYEDP